MIFERHFTKEGTPPFDTVEWKLFNCKIVGKKGNIVFEQKDVEFPSSWGQNDVDITAEKYFAGALNTKNRESSLKQVITRVAEWYTEKGVKDGYFTSSVDAEVFKDELMYILLHRYCIFNSPVLFNVGIHKDPQVSACFITSIEDTMDSISEKMKIEMDIFRKGSGDGTNLSNVRSSKEKVATGGNAMGPLPIIRISDKIAAAVKSGGKTRRAALMKELNIEHGDIEDFITQKAEVEKAAKVLIRAGWSNDFDDPKGAYGLLGLQNFNESVSIFDSFMESLYKDEDWALISINPYNISLKDSEHKRTQQGVFVQDKEGDWFLQRRGDGGNLQYFRVLKWAKAKDLWNLICQSAWECADPGLQFYDTINKWNTCKNDGEITGSNPCSEYFFLENTSCNLASHNLLMYEKEDGTFDYTSYMFVTRLFITAMDISVHNASYPTKKIANRTKQYRTVGLGYSNVGALLLSKGIPYDSDEGRFFIGSLTALLLATSYNTSAQLAKELGAFERYEANKHSVSNVLNMHKDEIIKLITDVKYFLTSYESNVLQQSKDILQVARDIIPIDVPIRNAQTVVIAPTGTIAFWLGAETTGIEPMLGLKVYKKMVGGGFLELTSSCVKKGLSVLGYNKRDIEIIQKQIQENGYVVQNPLKEEHIKIFETSFGKQNLLKPEAHVKMMAVCQPFISGAISKTVNLTENSTVEDISKIYQLSWDLGLKSVSVYRDNCKGSQPLTSSIEDEKLHTNGRPIPVRKRLPKKYPSHGHEFQIGNQKGFLNLGFYPDTKELGATFITISKAGSTLNGFMNAIAILISHMLQYKIPVEEVISTLRNLQFDPSGFTDNPDIKTATSIPDYVAKYIENYLQENTIKEENVEIKKSISSVNQIEGAYGPPCNVCGQLTVKAGTCFRCINCGETTGCS
jgi:ribonucleoside-diphosphate reductase alpha chain